jgi:hypothetical protein
MVIQGNFLFNHGREAQSSAPSSGDGAASPAATWPATGEAYKSYEVPAVAPRLSTAGALGDEGAHGDLGSFRRAQTAASGVKPGGSAGMAVGGDTTDDFHTVGGHFVDEQTGTGYGVGGEDHLVTRKGALPPDTNSQSAGKAI